MAYQTTKIGILKKVLAFSAFIIFIACSVVAQAPVVSPVNFSNLVGCWQGTRNYSGTIIRKPYSTAAALIVKQIGKTNSFRLLSIYTTDSTKVTDTLTISKTGKKINAGVLKSKRYTTAGELEIITEAPGFDHDENKAVIVRETYLVAKQHFLYKRQIQLAGQNDWLDRQEFSYTRKPCNFKNLVH